MDADITDIFTDAVKCRQTTIQFIKLNKAYPEKSKKKCNTKLIRI